MKLGIVVEVKAFGGLFRTAFALIQLDSPLRCRLFGGVLYAMASAQVWSLHFLHEFSPCAFFEGTSCCSSFPSRTRL